MSILINKNPEKHYLYIEGNWCEPVSNSYYDVISPATGKVISQGSNCDSRDVEKAIHAAHHAFKTWSRISANERSHYLIRIAHLLIENIKDLAKMISTETGKPLREARLEVESAANCILQNSEEAKRAYGEVIPSPNQSKRLQAIKQSVGPVAAITPWDYPLSQTARKIAPALAAGCTIVLKSDSQTPGSVAALFKIVGQANLPDGVLNFITGKSATIEEALIKDDRIKKITYTGLSHIGHILIDKAIAEEKSLSLNFGNKSPYIVFEDADLNEAVNGVIDIKFRNINQTFSESAKIYVQQAIKEKFLALLKERVEQLSIGNGLDELIDLGPVANANHLSVIKNQVEDALAKGAKLITGGSQCKVFGHEDGFYFEPTIIDQINENMMLCHEDIFRPLVPIYSFNTESEVIEKAKSSCNGSSVTILTKDLSLSIRMSHELGHEMLIDRSESEMDNLNEFIETKFITIGM